MELVYFSFRCGKYMTPTTIGIYNNQNDRLLLALHILRTVLMEMCVSAAPWKSWRQF